VAGSFRDRSVDEEMNRASISEQITVRQGPEARSHTAGFEVRTAFASVAVCSAGNMVYHVSRLGWSHCVHVHHDCYRVMPEERKP